MASWVIRESGADSTTFDWLICLDLKGNFPRYIINKVRFIDRVSINTSWKCDFNFHRISIAGICNRHAGVHELLTKTL